MIITTTNNIEGRQIVDYKGIVFGEVVAGANIIRDFFASITDFLGGRSGAYESRLNSARQDALNELQKEAQRFGANAVVGVDISYQSMGSKDMFIVVASGTAVVIR